MSSSVNLRFRRVAETWFLTFLPLLKKAKEQSIRKRCCMDSPSIVDPIPIILLKQEEPRYNKTIEMARRLDLMSLRYAMPLFFETILF